MRIAYVMNSLEGGGGTFPVPEICRILRECGAEVRVFALTPRDRLAEAPILAAGIVCRVRAGGNKDHRAAYRWLVEELEAWRPTHLWSSLSRSTIIGMFIARKFGLPHICWQHNAYLKPKYRWTLRAFRRQIDLWVADSRNVADFAVAALKVPQDKMMSWPIVALPADPPQSRPWQPGQRLEMGSLGRLHPRKEYHTLIPVLHRLKIEGFTPPAPLRLRIGGEGREHEALAARIRDLGMTNVELLGFVDRPLDFLATLHLYVQPSIREGFCVAAHEAMAAALPVVGTRIGEMAHSIEDGVTGYSFPSGDVTALAQALRRALSTPERLAPMGAAARALVMERFSQERFDAAGRAVMKRVQQLAA